tara:strand:- start:42 stop:1004 length:963 start_codon:yes stop_codon:yes gene_type:complete
MSDIINMLRIEKTNPDYSIINYKHIIDCKYLDDSNILTEFHKLQKYNCKKINNGFAGNKIIYSLFLKNMLETRRGKLPLLREIFDNESDKKKLIDNSIKYSRRKKLSYLEPVDLYEAFRFLKGSVNTFKAGIVKHLIHKYKATKYLDPCMGWGGRYLGARSMDIEYYGFDTNTSLIEGYEKLLNITDGDTFKDTFSHKTRLSSHNTKMFFGDCLSYEGEFYDSINYDFVLTSPPYLNVEVYENMTKFNEHYNYYTDFLIPLVNKCLKHIVTDGVVCINISEYIYKDYLANGGIACNDTFELPQQLGGKKNKEMIYIFYKN